MRTLLTPKKVIHCTSILARRGLVLSHVVISCLVCMLTLAVPAQIPAPGKSSRLKGQPQRSLPSPPIKTVTGSESQRIQDVLAFVGKYRAYAGAQALIDQIKDTSRLGQFLREYKLVDAQTAGNQNFLDKLQDQIYQDLIGNLLSYQKTAEAVAVYRQMLNARPGDASLKFGLARLLSEEPGRYSEALSIYDGLLKEKTESSAARLGMARVQAALRNFPEALRHFGIVLQAQPQDFSLKLEYIRLLSESGRYADAVQLLNQISARAPESLAVKTESARLKVRMNDLKSADEELTILMNDPKITLALRKEAYAIHKERLAKQDELSWRRHFATMLCQDRRTFDLAALEYQEIINRGRATAEDRLALARLLSWQKQFDDSIKIYQAMLTTDLSSLLVLSELTSVLRWAGRFSEALVITNRLIAMRPAAAEHKLEKARILVELKQYEEGLQIYRDLIPADPQPAMLQVEYARALRESGRVQQACTAYEQILPMVVGTDIALEYARTLIDARRYADSDRIYQQILAEKPDDPVLKLEYAQALSWRNDFNSARHYFDQGTKSAFEARRTFGKLLFWNGKYEEARAEFLSLLNLKDNDRELRLDAARALVRLEQFEEALNELEQLRAEHPDNPEIAAEHAQATVLRKQRAANLEKPEAPTAHVKPAVMPPAARAISQKSLNTLNPIMIAPLRANPPVTAKDLEEFEKSKQALDAAGDDDQLRLQVAHQALWAKKYGEAVKRFRAIIADNPSETEAYVGLAEAYLYQDDYANALRLFQRALADDADNIRARFGLAQIYAYGMKLQDPHRARKELGQVLALAFTHVPAWETYNDLSREFSRSLGPFSQNLRDSDFFSRFSAGTDYRYPFRRHTTLVGNYRYQVVRQDFRRRFVGRDYSSWFGRTFTGRSYEFGLKQRVSAKAQFQGTLGKTNFNGGRSFLNAFALLEYTPRSDHLLTVGYEREPAIVFLNTIMVLGAGLYGNRFQAGHTYDFHSRWELTHNYQWTRLASNRSYEAPYNAIRQVEASVRRRITRDFRLGAGYSFVAFREHSLLYYSPRGDRSLRGDFSFQKSNRWVSATLYGAVAKLFMDRSHGYYILAKTDLTFHPSRDVQLDLSYQPLYSSAGSVLGFNRYRYHTVLINLRYWLDNYRDRIQ
ncbi:MAG: tetratricopeptide repeat protein [Acidobacteria bacterium]|nr:tetratricopeptide repeat protein [Acidobacteriota bacterium]MBI3655736.1 tetratricopeptide repeat protein [Acidobacteriota bacterium]